MLRFSLRDLFTWGSLAPPPRSPTHFVQIGISSPDAPCKTQRHDHVLVCEVSVECPINDVLLHVDSLFQGDFLHAAAVLVWAPLVGSRDEETFEQRSAQTEIIFLALARHLARRLGSNGVYAMVSPQTSSPDAAQLRELAHQVLALVDAGVLERNILHGASEMWALVFNAGNTERGAVG